jgi:hypothetical protein
VAIITADDLRVHLGISGAQHNQVLDWVAAAANQWVGQWCGRTFDLAAAPSERFFNPINGYIVDVDDFATTTGLIVKTDTGDDATYETTWTSGDYQVEPLNQMIDNVTVPYSRIRAVESLSFPTSSYRPSVAVTARWGWTTPPPAVFQATLLKAARLYHRKDSPQGVAGFDQFGAVRLSGHEDPDVVSLLAPFRRSAGVVMIG